MEKQVAAPTNLNWMNSLYPFDPARCGQCLVQHQSSCGDPKHEEMWLKVQKSLNGARGFITSEWLAKNFDTVLSLRQKYDRFWK